MEPAGIQDVLRRLAARGRAVVRSRPFLVVLDPQDAGSHANFAIPSDRAAPDARRIDALRRPFAERGLVPRIEWVAEVSPEVGPALTRAGFRQERWASLLSCPVADLAAPPMDLVLETVPFGAGSEGLRPLVDLQRVAFGLDPLPDGAAVPALRGGAVVGRLGPLVVAVAEFSEVVGGVVEITGVATGSAYRGRGYGGALTAAAARASGATTAVLGARDDHAARVYERIGFRRVATVVHAADADGASVAPPPPGRLRRWFSRPPRAPVPSSLG